MGWWAGGVCTRACNDLPCNMFGSAAVAFGPAEVRRHERASSSSEHPPNYACHRSLLRYLPKAYTSLCAVRTIDSTPCGRLPQTMPNKLLTASLCGLDNTMETVTYVKRFCVVTGDAAKQMSVSASHAAVTLERPIADFGLYYYDGTTAFFFGLKRAVGWTRYAAGRGPKPSGTLKTAIVTEYPIGPHPAHCRTLGALLTPCAACVAQVPATRASRVRPSRLSRSGGRADLRQAAVGEAAGAL